MTLKVFKYDVPIGDVPIGDEVEISLPYEADILDVQFQRDKLCMWALVDPDHQSQTRRFRIAGTGHPIEYSWGELTYISTFQMRGGDLIFHMFEIGKVLVAKR